ncbi:MAG: T9SS C-terminal target domain-containing protein, partial [Bacteroidaceae bacterium]
MKTITLIGKRMLATALLACCMATGFAQKWNFDPAETKAFANWFKQPSTEQGKINAEVLGIDIKRAGFSWDDMNTWADASGTVFLEGYNTAYVHTIWGGGFSGNTTFKGRLHY